MKNKDLRGCLGTVRCRVRKSSLELAKSEKVWWSRTGRKRETEGENFRG